MIHYKPTFSISFSRVDKAIILIWLAEKEYCNIFRERWLVFYLRWPPVKWLTCFHNRALDCLDCEYKGACSDDPQRADYCPIY